MKARNARNIVVVLLGLAFLSIWLSVLRLHATEQSSRLESLPPPNSLNYPDSITKRPHAPANKTTLPSKPYFVLHIGPPKTATTTIQCGLETLSAKLVKEDSYFFIGKRCPHTNETMANGETGIPGHHLMMGLINANPNSRGFEKLKERMEFHYSKGNNMIFSLEAMSNHLEDKPKTWELLLSLFESWNVRVVVGYRHYFDWIRSMYFQQHIGKKYTEKWPHQNGLEHPAFQEYLSYHLDRWTNNNPSNDGYSFGQHLSLYALQYFQEHFDDVQVFNLHQDGDVLTNFICQMLPGSDATCMSLKREEKQSFETRRESHSFNGERLAMAAYKLGILNGNISRTKAVEKTKLQLASHTLNEQSFICLSKQLESTFLNASLWFHNKISMAQKNSISGFMEARRNHERDFSQALHNRKFCEIDPGAILKDKEWQNFFTSIQPKRKNK